MDRRFILAATVAGHLGAVILLLTPAVAVTVQPVPAMIAIAVPAPVAAPPTPVAPTPTPIVIAAEVPEPMFELAAEVAAVIPVTGADGCGLTDAVAAALQADPAVGDAVRRIPHGARSVANAVLVWNGDWVDPASVGGPAVLDTIRIAVQASVAAAPKACRTAAVIGPRLVLIADRSRPMVLALGSGVWAWGQLAAS